MYRAPLVFSGLSCLVGNLVLCLSYDTKLLPLLYVARLVTGVGVLSNPEQEVECLNRHIELRLAMLVTHDSLACGAALPMLQSTGVV